MISVNNFTGLLKADILTVLSLHRIRFNGQWHLISASRRFGGIFFYPHPTTQAQVIPPPGPVIQFMNVFYCSHFGGDGTIL